MAVPQRPTREFVALAANAAREETDDRRAVLQRLAGPEPGCVHRLPEGIVTIGRGDASTICIDDSSVSRHHATFTVERDLVVLEDAGSTNGTWVNGQRVRNKRLLADGDRIRFGLNALLKFSLVCEAEEALKRRLYQHAVRDELTGAFNRRYLFERLDQEVSYACRHGSALALLIIDLDHFKAINDRYGHPAGDQVLRVVAQRIASSVRHEDVFARYGGEELAVLARVGAAGACQLAERLRARIAAAPVPWRADSIAVTASVGVGVVGRACSSAAKLLADADVNLYAAKDAGRNRVVGPAAADPSR